MSWLSNKKHISYLHLTCFSLLFICNISECLGDAKCISSKELNGKVNSVNLVDFGFSNPFEGFVGSKIEGSFFSDTYPYGEHLGTDFIVKSGTPVKAICKGEVIDASHFSYQRKSEEDGGRGKSLYRAYWDSRYVIKCTETQQEIYLIYGHTDEINKLFTRGATVEKGEMFAKIANAYTENGARASYNDHLHLGLNSKKNIFYYGNFGFGIAKNGVTEKEGVKKGYQDVLSYLCSNPIKNVMPPLASCSNDATDRLKSIATAIVFDHSGSMKEERKIDYAREATVSYVSNMAYPDHISVSTFSNDATTPPGLEMQSKEQLGSKLISILVTLSPDGKTNIGAGLAKGLDQLCSVDSEKFHKGALLLSDGMNNVGEYQSIVEKYKEFNIPISTIRFGQKASEKNLKRIALDTGGIYWPADQSNVASVYSRQIDAINGNSTILSTHDLMGPVEANDYRFTVTPGAENLNINTSWHGSRLKTILTSPSGSSYSEQQLPSTTDRFEEGAISQFTQILNPEAGEWAINMGWDIAPQQAERVNLSISEHLDVYTNILGFSPQYMPGQRVTINVQAAELGAGNNKIPLSSARVQAQVQIPGPEIISEIQAQSTNFRVYKEVLQDNMREIELFDDGMHDDYAAGDGIFGGYFQETAENGSYIVTAQIEGIKADGARIRRQTVSSFQVGPLSANSVTTSQIIQHTSRLNEQLKTKVVNPLGNMQGSSSNSTQPSDAKPKKKKRSRSLMDSLSN